MLFRPACGSWACPECGAKSARRWIAILIYGMNQIGGDWYFCTFTAHEKWRKNASLVNLRKNWHKLRKRLSRASENELYYAWVYEPHKDNSWHVHVLCNVGLSTKWWKDNARQCGMGHQAKASKAKNAGMVAGYCSKYMLKAVEMHRRYPKGMRRINISRNWPKKTLKRPESDFDAVQVLKRHENPLKAYDGLVEAGWAVSDPGWHRYEWYPEAREPVAAVNLS